MSDIRSYFGRPIGRHVARIPAALAKKPSKPVIKVNSISSRSFLAPCKDVCSICLDTHQKGESITTQCGHEFGNQCWEQLHTTVLNGDIMCPLCRKACNFVNGYKQRKLTKKEQYKILVTNLWSKMDEESALSYKRFFLANPSAANW